MYTKISCGTIVLRSLSVVRWRATSLSTMKRSMSGLMAKNNNDLWVSDGFGGACSFLVLDEGGAETDSSSIVTEALFRDMCTVFITVP
jgi:hypothetical protein